MANIPENTDNPILRPVTRLETTTKVFGGEYIPDDAEQRGISNLQAIELAERDQYIISRVGQAAVEPSGDIPGQVGIAPLDTSGRVPKAQLPSDTVYTEATQTLKNKTIDGKDNTILNTPITISTSQTYNFTKETDIDLGSSATLTLGTAPYVGFEVTIYGEGYVAYSPQGWLSITDHLRSSESITYVHQGSGYWWAKSGSTWYINSASIGPEWKLYRGIGVYNYVYQVGGYDQPSVDGDSVVSVTWGGATRATAVGYRWISSAQKKMWLASKHDSVWTGWTEVATVDGTQTLTNKTIDANSNTLVNVVTSKNITNCITAISQDINLTLSSGTLTLKAGSKVYKPNGKDGSTLLFTTVDVQTDRSLSSSVGTGTFMLYAAGTGIGWRPLSGCYSGTSDPATTGTTYYNTDTNIITAHNSSEDVQVSFPFCIVTTSGGAVTSIDQVFNGMGYIGSTLFVLPNVKLLLPNGRNADGSLKNTEKVVESVETITNSSSGTRIIVHGGGLGDNSIAAYSYNENINYLVQTNDGSLKSWAIIATCNRTSGAISNFKPKTPFHAVDWNDFMLGNGTIHTTTSLETGFTGTVSWCVRNGMCVLTVWNVVAASANTSQIVLNGIPKAKMNCAVPSQIASALWIVNKDATYLKTNPINAGQAHFTVLTYPVADDWVES